MASAHSSWILGRGVRWFRGLEQGQLQLKPALQPRIGIFNASPWLLGHRIWLPVVTTGSRGLVVLRGVYPFLSWHELEYTSEQANPSVLAGYWSHMRANLPSKQAASFGPKVQGSSGASTTCSSSVSGVGEEGAEAGVGAVGFFSATSNISIFRRQPSSMRDARYWQRLLYCPT